MPAEEPRDSGTEVAEDAEDADEEKPEDPSSGCFACQNMDAYWAEKARTDPVLRDRLAALERARMELREDD